MNSKSDEDLGWTGEKPMMRRYMTREIALKVRSWRVDGEFTWRSIATEWNETVSALDSVDREYFQYWSGHQKFGHELCEVAAEILGEDANAAPWN